MSHQLTIVAFSKLEIIPCDLTGFLSAYDVQKLPIGTDLRDMLNSFAFTVLGYDDDPRELYEIPEVRRFYTKLWEAWPYWFYFCNLELNEMLVMVACVVDSVTKVAQDGKPNIGLHLPREYLVPFLQRGFRGLNVLCSHAGLGELQIEARSAEVARYFDATFDNCRR